MPITRATIAPILLITGALATAASAGVRLNTLPPRERVEIQLDHDAVTLVEEERDVPLAQGTNDVTFSWSNTSIDPGSVQFHCLGGVEGVQVISVSYPPEGNVLTWQVSSPRAGSARVRISYIIGGLHRTFMYRAVAAKDEKTLDLRRYIQLHNTAPEAFGTAGMWAGQLERLERPIGASETKQLLIERVPSVKVQKTYTAELSAFGWLDEGQHQLRVPMHYVIRNDEASGLGKTPLQAGKVRIFQDDGRGTDAFLGEDWAGLTTRDNKMRLNIGTARDVVVKRTIDKRDRKQTTGNMSDYDIVIKYEIENFKDTEVVLDIAESPEQVRSEIVGHTGRPVEWTIGGSSTLKDIDPEESSADRMLFHVTLPPRGDDQKAQKITHTLHLVIRNEW